jgi:P27 family predicted phage terminase small subunit
MRVLTEADGLVLGNLCLAVSTLVRAQAKLNETGILYKAPSGYVMQSPLLPVVNAQVDTISRLSREFGLTPAARSRLTITGQDADIDVLERALCG